MELFYGEQRNIVRDTTITPLDENREFIQRLQKSEVEGALKKWTLKKIVNFCKDTMERLPAS